MDRIRRSIRAFLGIDKLEEQMASTTEDLVARLKTATDEIAKDLAALRDQVAQSNPDMAAQFEPLVARLEAMGQDPSDPVPQ